MILSGGLVIEAISEGQSHKGIQDFAIAEWLVRIKPCKYGSHQKGDTASHLFTEIKPNWTGFINR